MFISRFLWYCETGDESGYSIITVMSHIMKVLVYYVELFLKINKLSIIDKMFDKKLGM